MNRKERRKFWKRNKKNRLILKDATEKSVDKFEKMMEKKWAEDKSD